MATWVVNDYLTCVPGTKTFWHMLLEIKGTIDKTGVAYPRLAEKIETDPNPCDLIIRNVSFFRPIKRAVKQIGFLQDRAEDDPTQIEVCRSVDTVVFNSEYTKQAYQKWNFPNTRVIPIGVNEELFRPKAMGRLFPNDRPVGIFVGDYNATKGTDIFEQVVRRKPYINFIYVSKQGARINTANVANFAGGVDELGMSKLYNLATFSIMCSPVETLHLASIEACLCDKPAIGTNTGWFANYFSPTAGVVVPNPSVEAFCKAIDQVVESTSSFSPREHILTTPFVWSNCRSEWEKLIQETLNGQT
jgi:hypothetical protein